uniref:EF-hand domain-containing protein n=1 Tax=Magallana gigas TaxID=29159 RepID=A0A8W8KRI9_MAGGI|nr:uncharacterized protein LOC105345409 [Crassostrea gigas]|eukprot:XP_011451843.1 PREDICTED: uncharacterized protein LOC105345409 [Crassostrea gigas]
MIAYFLLLTVTSVLGAPTDQSHSALEQFKNIIRTQVTTLWHTVDKNGDGRFEASDMHHIFDDYDANHDHSVTKHEFVSRFAHNEPELNIIGEGLFLEFDMNQDGAITVSDLDLYYQKIDSNNNGHVEKEEFVHYFTEIFTILYVIQLNQTTVAPGGR